MFITTVNQEAAKPGQWPHEDIPRKTYKTNKTITQYQHSIPGWKMENLMAPAQMQVPQNEFAGSQGSWGLLASSQERCQVRKELPRYQEQNAWPRGAVATSLSREHTDF